MPLLFHRWRVAVLQNDLSTARQSARRALELAPDFERAGSLRWWLAVKQEDSGSVEATRQRLVRLSDIDLAAVYGWSIELGVPFTDVKWAAERLVQRSVTIEERARAMWRLYFTHIFQGRPRDASVVWDRLAVSGLLTHASQTRALAAAMNSIGARSDAEQVIRELVTHATKQLATAQPERSDQLNDLCWLGRWYLHTRDVETAARYAQPLSRQLGQAADGSDSPSLRACSLELDAERAHSQNRTDADRLLAALDSAMKTAPTGTAVEGNLAVARLKEARGDLAGALAAVRRRTHFWNYLFFLDAQLLEEARLATTLGDRRGAIRAYRHYLALRSDPEPSVLPAIQSARRTLDSLLSAEAR